ncbi:MAG: Ig-like domain-containing protein [Lachnospiraceae bacterium]
MKKITKRLLLLALLLSVTLSMTLPTTSDAASKSPKKITLKASSTSVTVGKTVKVKVKSVKPKNASKTVTFKSSNGKIASVSSKGVVTGKKAGKVTITATSKKNKKVKAKLKITVKNPTPTKLTLTANCTNIGIGCTCSVSVKSVTPQNASKSVTYSSSDKDVATVTSKGLVTGVGKGTATITATSTVNKKVKASVTINVVYTQQGVVTNSVDLSNKEAGKVAKVWLPVPQSDENQTIKDVKLDAPYATKVIDDPDNKDSEGNRVCYIEWDENVAPENRVATLSYHVSRKEVVRPNLVEKGSVDKEKFAKYLKETEKSGSFAEGSIVKTTADKIVSDANATTVLEKAKAIFDWEVANLHRDNSVTGCGLGDVEKILTETYGGKCTDLNSVFVALLRAEGIPAREMFGIRINADDITGNQHCRAQFYLPGTGWVEADPADVLKQALTDGKQNTDPDYSDYIEPIKDKYWGGNNEKWVMLSMERDITLNPAQSAQAVEGGILNSNGTLNNFGYPYGEFDGEYISCYSAKDFIYTYTFVQDDAKDCC